MKSGICSTTRRRWIRLNEAAVSGACEEPHNRVAREAADGTGGLYRLRAGDEDLAQARFAVWLSKPNGVSYKDFYAGLGIAHVAARSRSVGTPDDAWTNDRVLHSQSNAARTSQATATLLSN